MKILIASTNKGKIAIYKQVCNELGLETTDLTEVIVNQKIEENGKNELENAIIKAKAYNEITHLPVIANDSGLIIDKFDEKDQPKELVRRYNGKELTDEELIDIYIEKLNKVGGQSDAHFVVALALINEKGEMDTKLFYPKRNFINIPSKVIKKGLPLESLTYDNKTQKYMSEMTTIERNNYEAEEMKKQKQFIEEFFIK